MTALHPGIHAYVGANGSGKTLRAVEELVLPSLAVGRPVLCAPTIFASVEDAHLPREQREVHPLWVPMTSWKQLLGLESTTVLLDEITTAFGARESAKMPFQVAAALQQLRKGDVVLGWTAPSWKRADTILRECTQWVTLCRGFWPEPVEGRRRGANRWFRYRIYDAQAFEEFSVGSATSNRSDSLHPVSSDWYRRKRHRAHLLYDTYEAVPMLDHLDQHGTCLECGGVRSRKKCECVHGDADPADVPEVGPWGAWGAVGAAT